MIFKGLGVQKGTQTPCWLRPCLYLTVTALSEAKMKSFYGEGAAKKQLMSWIIFIVSFQNMPTVAFFKIIVVIYVLVLQYLLAYCMFKNVYTYMFVYLLCH